MKLNYTSILTAATLMVAGANANAGMLFDIYAGGTAGFGGMAMYQEDHNRDWSSQSYGVIAGVDLPVVRFEAEYDYLKSDRIDMQTIMGNAYVKLPGIAVVNPYIGVGVGAMIDAKVSHYPVDFDTTIAYQGMLGATLNIPAVPFKVDVEGRVLYMPEVYDKHDIEIDAMQYDARVKLRYVF